MSLAVVAMTVAKLTLATGVTLEYVERGDPNGTPVIFLHGVTDSWRSFEHVLPHLPPSIRAIAITQRGHGDSKPARQGYAYGDIAADVAAFMDALRIRRRSSSATRWAAWWRSASQSTIRSGRGAWCCWARSRR